MTTKVNNGTNIQDSLVSGFGETLSYFFRTLPSDAAIKYLPAYLPKMTKFVAPIAGTALFATSAISNWNQENFWAETTKDCLKQTIPFVAINMIVPGSTYALLVANAGYNMGAPLIGSLGSDNLVNFKLGIDNLYNTTINLVTDKAFEISKQVYEDISTRSSNIFTPSSSPDNSKATAPEAASEHSYIKNI